MMPLHLHVNQKTDYDNDVHRPQDKSAELKIIFLTKTYVVGTQKNRLNETFLLSTKIHV